jgi:hypothetical protein
MTLTDITNPTIPGTYPVAVSFVVDGAVTGSTTLYLTVEPNVLTGVTLFRLNSDRDL